MNKEDLIRKLTSRKFLLALAAFLGTFATGCAGVIPPEFCAIGMALSAGIYAACEAYVDGQAAKANQTIATTSISASSASQKVVEKAFSNEG